MSEVMKQSIHAVPSDVSLDQLDLASGGWKLTARLAVAGAAGGVAGVAAGIAVGLLVEYVFAD